MLSGGGLHGAPLPELLLRHGLGGTLGRWKPLLWGCATTVVTLQTHLRPPKRSIKAEMKCNINREVFQWPIKEYQCAHLVSPFEN